MDKSKLQHFFFEDPKLSPVDRRLGNNRLQYYYFDRDLKIVTEKHEILNGCLLEGNGEVIFQDKHAKLNQFDLFFLPPNREVIINIIPKEEKRHKICLYSSYIKTPVTAEFEVQRFSLDKFLPRGEFGSVRRMATYRTVWTAIQNGYFMSGFTNIPMKALRQGVVTSVNIEAPSENCKEIYPHIHPDFPEVYVFCIDDDKYAVTQYLIDEEGNSVCQDVTNGGGVFFPGNLGHMNFAKPFGKNIKYCMYLWYISTLGRTTTIIPRTLRV
jgi:hypothetical protein